jgi:predicted ester cyclase
MEAPTNKEIVQALYDRLFNGGDLSAADDLVADDFVNHTGPPDGPKGPQSLKSLVGWLHGAFPDSRYTIKKIVAEDDHVAVYLAYDGTHLGPFMGAAPTGRHFSQDQMHLMRLQDGKIAEHWAVRDDLGRMRQLGMIPEPAAQSV